MSAVGGQIVLRAEGVTKAYPGTVALDRVDFNVYRGRVNVLIGENGAGKSTLVKILAGVEKPTSGRIHLDGREVAFASTRDADRAGISMIHQELNLCPNLSVAENIFLARERTLGGILVDRARQDVLARRWISRLEPSIRTEETAGRLPLGCQQIVEIAKALARDARILIMDEPTSALSGAEVEALFRVIRELTSSGVSVVYISHRLEELLRIGDVITVLRDGRRVDEAPAGEVDVQWIVERMVGGRVDSIYRRAERQPGSVCLEARSLSLPCRDGGFHFENVSFALRRGEILGLYGLMGAGRTELLESLIGLRTGTRGEMIFDGRPLGGLSVAERIRAGLALLPEDRQASGIVPFLNVRENVALSSLDSCRVGWMLDNRKIDAGVTRLAKELAIRAASIRQPIASLSGGNQQKVVLAKGLFTTPKVLLLDEPTRGIDVGAKAEICEIINRLAAQGMGVLYASSELDEILAVADRILVLSKGRPAGEFPWREASGTKLVAAASAFLDSDPGGDSVRA